MAVCIFTVFIMAMAVIFPADITSAAKDGLLLWANSVAPSLLPFMICAAALNSLGFTNILYSFRSGVFSRIMNVPPISLFPFFMGILSGYPVGAKMTCILAEDGTLLSKYEAQRTLSFASNVGLVFCVGTVASSMMGKPKAGFYIFAMAVLSSFTTGAIFRFYKGKNSKLYSNKNRRRYNNSSNKVSIGDAFSSAIKMSAETIVMVGGFIMLFSVIFKALEIVGAIKLVSYFVSYVTPFSNETLECFITGIIEITNGAKTICSSSLDANVKMTLLCSTLSFGGLCVSAQVVGVIGKSGIDVKTYMISKAMNGVFAGIYSWILFPFVFKGDSEFVFSPQDIHINALAPLYIAAIVITLVAVYYRRSKKL